MFGTVPVRALAGRCLFLGAALVAGACAPPPTRGAESAAREFSSAAAEKRDRAVLARLTDGAAAALGEKEAKRLLTHYAEEQRALAAELAKGEYRIEVEARYALPDGRELRLKSEGENFVVRDVFGLLAPERTPLATLTRLRQALAVLSEAQILRLLVPERREALGSYLRALRKGLSELGDASIVERGDLVTVRLSSGLVVYLRKDNGEYFVTELE